LKAKVQLRQYGTGTEDGQTYSPLWLGDYRWLTTGGLDDRREIAGEAQTDADTSQSGHSPAREWRGSGSGVSPTHTSCSLGAD
jgi:hypothetical protein